MIISIFLQASFLGMSFLTATAGKQSDTLISPTSTNCSADSTPCGPAACCSSGLECNFRRGIPICTNPAVHYISGYNHFPCADPYLFRCDAALGIPGFCCSIGSECINIGNNDIIHCIDALGTTALALPSATTGPVASATPISSSDTAIVYSPPQVWNISTSDSDCTLSKSLHFADAINATISFNFSGPSVMVHTVSSWNGGVFSVLVDGLNTTSTIDTYTGSAGNQSLPTCYPIQFPPFINTPTNYQYRENHTISLVYIGSSPLAPEGNNTSFVQFDSFAIPDLESVLGQTSKHGPIALETFNVTILYTVLIFFMYAML